MRILSAVLLLLLTVAFADAQHNGFVNSDGYSYSNGLWFYPGYQAGYTRVFTPACYVNGCYRAGYYTYIQQAYVPPTQNVIVNVTPPPPPYSKDWKVQGIQYLEKLNDLEAFEAFYSSIGVRRSGSAYSSSSLIGANATTGYGYQVNQLQLNQRAYGDDEVALSQAGLSFGQNVGKAIDSGTTLAGLQGDILDRQIALLNARRSYRDQLAARLQAITPTGKAIEGVAKAVGSGPTTIESNATFTTKTPVAIQPVQPQDNRIDALQSLMASKCASCHSGSKISGGVDLALYLRFDAKSKERVYRAVSWTNPDTKLRMPPNAPLTPTEQALFAPNQ